MRLPHEGYGVARWKALCAHLGEPEGLRLGDTPRGDNSAATTMAFRLNLLDQWPASELYMGESGHQGAFGSGELMARRRDQGFWPSETIFLCFARNS